MLITKFCGMTVEQINKVRAYMAEHRLKFCKKCNTVYTEAVGYDPGRCPSCVSQMSKRALEREQENHRFHHVPVEIDILITPTQWSLPLPPKFYTTGHVTGAWPEAHWPDVACQFAEQLHEVDAVTCRVDVLPGNGQWDRRSVRKEGLGMRYTVVKCEGKWSVTETSTTWVRIPGYTAMANTEDE